MEGKDDPYITEEVSWENERYFEEYSRTRIHASMLGDTRRNEAYAAALKPGTVRDKVVLDVGCGTGILSMLCARNGAKRVYAVEASDMVERARTVFVMNGLADRIVLLHGRVEEVDLPEQVDILVSEWMGVLLLFEGMAHSVLNARDRFLKPGGLILPTMATIFAAPVTMPTQVRDNIDVFRSVGGFDLSALVPKATYEYCAQALKSRNIPWSDVRGPPQQLLYLDLRTATSQDLREFVVRLDLPVVEDGRGVHGVGCFFEVTFSSDDRPCPPQVVVDSVDGELVVRKKDKSGRSEAVDPDAPYYHNAQGDIVFSTSPWFKETHFGQDIFLFESLVSLQPTRGPITGVVRVTENEHWKRHYNVIFDIQMENHVLSKEFAL